MSDANVPSSERICPHCGKVVARDREITCNHCGLDLVSSEERAAAAASRRAAEIANEVAAAPGTIIRTYRGKQQVDAVAAMRADAAALAQHGYFPTSQSWAQGQWGCGAFLVALLLCLLLVGILIFIYMLIVKPDGTLTVTYALNQDAPGTAPSPTVAAPDSTPPQSGPEPRTLAERLAQLDEARDAGFVTQEEYAERRGRILDEA